MIPRSTKALEIRFPELLMTRAIVDGSRKLDTYEVQL